MKAARPAVQRLLAVIVGEQRALVGDAVDVGRAVAHHAAVVGADVPVADVVAHDDEDVRLWPAVPVRLRLRGRNNAVPQWMRRCSHASEVPLSSRSRRLQSARRRIRPRRFPIAL